MKVDHLFGGHIYVISSYGVAKNPIYKDNNDVNFFSENIEKYLGEICDIYAYSHQVNQFHYLIKIKDRSELESYYYRKQVEKKLGKKNVSHTIYDLNGEVPPDSYLIFSQEVSNCLNSYAKKFNFRHNRKGGLFAGRYTKYLVETEEEMNEWIDRLNKMEELVLFENGWKVEEENVLENEDGECSSEVFYEGKSENKVHRVFSNFKIWIKNINIRGCFECLPPKSIKSPNYPILHQKYLKIKGNEPPW
jgi:hypothetical protein